MTTTSTDRLAGLSTSVAVKAPCKAVATTLITLSGEQTVGGVACVEGDRVLLAVTAGSIYNGIWICDSGAWARAKDFDGARDVVTGTMVLVKPGTADEQFWIVTTAGAIIIGTTAIVFEQHTPEELALRADLSSTADAAKGAGQIGFAGGLDYPGKSVGGELNTRISAFAEMTEAEIDDVIAGTASIDVSGKVQSAVTKAAVYGGEVYLPAGHYKWGVAASVTVPPNVSIVGAGQKATRIVTAMASAVTPAFNMNGSAVSSEVRCRFANFSIVGNGLGQAFQITQAAYLSVENIYTYGLTTHWNLVDVLSSQFRSVRSISGDIGLWARIGSVSRPNAITFDGCVIGSMNTNGLRIDDGTTLTVIGGSIEGCGTFSAYPTGDTTSAVLLNTVGHDGTWAATFVGTYFENNAGNGDVYIISSSSSALPAGVSFPGCTFNRTSAARHSKSNVYVVQAGGAGGLVVDVSSAGFNGFNDYVASASRPYVDLSAADAANIQLIETGAVYGSSTEAPTFNVSTPTAGVNITLGTSANAPKVRRDDQGYIILSGRLTSGAAIAADTTLATLDSKHRPNRVVYGAGFLTGSGVVYWYIDTAGLLKIGTAIAAAAQDIVLDGIVFRQVN